MFVVVLIGERCAERYDMVQCAEPISDLSIVLELSLCHLFVSHEDWDSDDCLFLWFKLSSRTMRVLFVPQSYCGYTAGWHSGSWPESSLCSIPMQVYLTCFYRVFFFK